MPDAPQLSDQTVAALRAALRQILVTLDGKATDSAAARKIAREALR